MSDCSFPVTLFGYCHPFGTGAIPATGHGQGVVPAEDGSNQASHLLNSNQLNFMTQSIFRRPIHVHRNPKLALLRRRGWLSSSTSHIGRSRGQSRPSGCRPKTFGSGPRRPFVRPRSHCCVPTQPQGSTSPALHSTRPHSRGRRHPRPGRSGPCAMLLACTLHAGRVGSRSARCPHLGCRVGPHLTSPASPPAQLHKSIHCDNTPSATVFHGDSVPSVFFTFHDTSRRLIQTS